MLPDPELNTRARLLSAALLLFRQRGYHGVGLSEILAAAGAPKGSLYHHFPRGKTELAIAVVADIEARLQRLIEAVPELDSAQLVRHLGTQVEKWMRRTGGDACALLASFAAEGDTAPALRDAVAQAYANTAKLFQRRLRRDGWTLAQARERATLVLVLFEGGGLVSHACADSKVFAASIHRAARLCERPTSRNPPPRSEPTT